MLAFVAQQQRFEMMRSRYTQAIDEHCEPLPAFRQMYALADPLVAACPENEVPFHLYGQAAALNHEMTASDLIGQLTR